MRLHTNVLTRTDIFRAVNDLPGVYPTVTGHGSRDFARAFEVRLEGNGYARNSGTSGGSGYENGATWDEWGAFIAALYWLDTGGRWGAKGSPVYKGYDDFHYRTGSRFEDSPGHLPADTHKRHKWEWNWGNADCTKCSAVIVRL